MRVQYDSQVVTLPVLVVQGSGPDLFGRDWLRRFRLDWEEICHKLHAQEVDDLAKILQENKEVFREGLGTLEGFKADIRVDQSAVRLKVFQGNTRSLCVEGED